jgi:hypothetical protein
MPEASLPWTTIFLFVMASVLLPLLLAEFTELAPWLAEKLVQRAIEGLVPPDQRGLRRTLEAQLLSYLEDIPGKLTKLCTATVIVVHLPAIVRAHRGLPPLREQLRRRLSQRLPVLKQQVLLTWTEQTSKHGPAGQVTEGVTSESDLRRSPYLRRNPLRGLHPTLGSSG